MAQCEEYILTCVILGLNPGHDTQGVLSKPKNNRLVMVTEYDVYISRRLISLLFPMFCTFGERKY